MSTDPNRFLGAAFTFVGGLAQGGFQRALQIGQLGSQTFVCFAGAVTCSFVRTVLATAGA